MRNSKLKTKNLNLFTAWFALGVAERRVALAICLWGVGEGLWLYVRPLYIAALGGNPAQVGQVLGWIGLAPALIMLPAGYLSDRFGPRGLMISSWWVGLAGTVAMAVAPDWGWLIPAALLYAVSAFAVPSINAYVALAASQRVAFGGNSSRAIQQAVTTVIAMYSVGLIASPIVGGWLGEAFGLRAVFWVSAAWFALSTLVVSTTPRLDHRAAIAASEPQPRPVGRRGRVSAGQARVYLTLVALFCCLALGYALLPNYLEEVRGLPLGVIGGLGSAFAVGNAFWLLLLGRVRPRLGLVMATGVVALALAAMLYEPGEGWQLPVLIAVYFLMAAYYSARTLSLGVVSEHTPPERRGTSFGLVEMIFGGGAFAGSWAAGLLYGQRPDLPFIAALVGLIPLLGVGWLAFRPPRSAQPSPGTAAQLDDVAVPGD